MVALVMADEVVWVVDNTPRNKALSGNQDQHEGTNSHVKPNVVGIGEECEGTGLVASHVRLSCCSAAESAKGKRLQVVDVHTSTSKRNKRFKT